MMEDAGRCQNGLHNEGRTDVIEFAGSLSGQGTDFAYAALRIRRYRREYGLPRQQGIGFATIISKFQTPENNMLNDQPFRALLFDRVIQAVTALPHAHDLNLLMRVPSKKDGTLIWGDAPPPTTVDAGPVDLSAVERVVHMLLQRMDEAPSYADWNEKGWRIVARLTRHDIESISKLDVQRP